MRRIRTALLATVAVLVPLAILVGALGLPAGNGTNASTQDKIVEGARWALSSPGTPVVPAPAAVQTAQAQIAQACMGVVVRDMAYTVINLTLTLTRS